MAHKINDHIYTQHALMDEIVYYTKIILNSIILKNDTTANNNETKESVDASELFISILNGNTNFNNIPLTASWLEDHGFAAAYAITYSGRREFMPEYAECIYEAYDVNIPQDENFKVTWNAALARYEYSDGTIAGKNRFRIVQYNKNDNKFYYINNNQEVPSTANIVDLKKTYYIDSMGRIVIYDNDVKQWYTLVGKNYLDINPTECMAAIPREYANNYYHEEQNNYYRTLMGLPEYGTHLYDIVWSSKLIERFSEQLKNSNVEFPLGVPIHEFTRKQINTLKKLGILDEIKRLYREDETFRVKTKLKKNVYVSEVSKAKWKYLDFLGDKKIDLYTARSAIDWDILYMPNVEHLVADRFKELFKINRDIYYRRTFQLAYQERSDYYEEMLMVMVLCQTFSDMITDTPEWYIRRDIFDLRSVKYFLDSNGIAFYKEIPLRYQILIVKNMNKLIRYKSTDKSIEDILAIFSQEDAKVYKYYIYKDYLYTDTTEEDEDEVDDTNWKPTGYIKNGDFETKNTEKWEITISDKPFKDYDFGDIDSSKDKFIDDPHDFGDLEDSNDKLIEDDEYYFGDIETDDSGFDMSSGSTSREEGTAGYHVRINNKSRHNITPYLYIWNNTDKDQYIRIYQNIKDTLPIGSYRLRLSYCGTKDSPELSVYLDDENLYNFSSSTGKDNWKTYTSEVITRNTTSDNIPFYITGIIKPGQSILIDNIQLYEYDESYDCGDYDADYVNLIEFTNAEEFAFRDESDLTLPDDSYKKYIYDFGDEDGDTIAESSYTDVYTDTKEKSRIIKDEVGNVYRLMFVKTEFEDTYDNYIKDNINQYQYDVITEQDKYWDGQDTHYYVRNKHLEKEFTIEGTKYYSLQFELKASEYYYQREYYLSLLFSNTINTDSVTIPVPTISEDTSFKLQDLLLFTLCLNGIYNDQAIDINISNYWFNRTEQKPEYSTFYDLNGGRPWDESATPIVIPDNSPKPFEVPDLDFGDNDVEPDSYFRIDQYTEWYDFGDILGYGNTDPNKAGNVDNYDYEDELDGTFESAEEEEKAKKEIEEVWPLRNILDFQDEDTDPVIITKYSPILDFGDIDNPEDDGYNPPRIYDFNAEYVSREVDIGQHVWPVKYQIDYGDEDSPDPSTELYTSDIDLGNADYSYLDGSTSDIVYDFNGDDYDSEIKYQPLDEYPAFYVQNDPKYTIFKYYEYDNDAHAYKLVYDYSSPEADIPDIDCPYEYDTIINITKDNYKQYLGGWIVDPTNGDQIQLTEENWMDFLGRQFYIYAWHYLKSNSYTIDADGHFLYRDKDFIDVTVDKSDLKYKHLDKTPAKGKISPILNNWRNNYNGGRIIFFYEPTGEYYYDWLRSNYPYFWPDMEARLHSFNMNADLVELSKDVGIRHSTFGWKHGYTLDELGVNNFVSKKSFKNTAEMQQVYEINTECYNNLVQLMESPKSRDDLQVLEYVYAYLFTVPYTNDFYRLSDGTIAATYDQLLKDHDYTLYTEYLDLLSEPDKETRIDNVRQVLNDIVDTLSYYIHGNSLRYVLSFIATNNIDALMHYIMLMLNFFKSWKVYFLDPRAQIYIDDKFDNTVNRGDGAGQIKPVQWIVDDGKIRDSVPYHKPYYVIEERPGVPPHDLDYDNSPNEIISKHNLHTYHKNASIVDGYAHYYDNNILQDRDCDGDSPQTHSEYIDLDGGDPSTDNPTYEVNGGSVAARINPYDLDGGGAGLLSKEQYYDKMFTIDNQKPVKSDSIHLVNKPAPKDSDSCLDIDGGGVGTLTQTARDIADAYGVRPVNEPSWQERYSYPDIDGGGPGLSRTSTTKTMITHISDYNEVTAEVKVAYLEKDRDRSRTSVWGYDFGDIDDPEDELEDFTLDFEDIEDQEFDIHYFLEEWWPIGEGFDFGEIEDPQEDASEYWPVPKEGFDFGDIDDPDDVLEDSSIGFGDIDDTFADIDESGLVGRVYDFNNDQTDELTYDQSLYTYASEHDLDPTTGELDFGDNDIMDININDPNEKHRRIYDFNSDEDGQLDYILTSKDSTLIYDFDNDSNRHLFEKLQRGKVKPMNGLSIEYGDDQYPESAWWPIPKEGYDFGDLDDPNTTLEDDYIDFGDDDTQEIDNTDLSTTRVYDFNSNGEGGLLFDGSLYAISKDVKKTREDEDELMNRVESTTPGQIDLLHLYGDPNKTEVTINKLYGDIFKNALDMQKLYTTSSYNSLSDYIHASINNNIQTNLVDWFYNEEDPFKDIWQKVG